MKGGNFGRRIWGSLHGVAMHLVDMVEGYTNSRKGLRCLAGKSKKLSERLQVTLRSHPKHKKGTIKICHRRNDNSVRKMQLKQENFLVQDSIVTDCKKYSY